MVNARLFLVSTVGIVQVTCHCDHASVSEQCAEVTRSGLS